MMVIHLIVCNKRVYYFFPGIYLFYIESSSIWLNYTTESIGDLIREVVTDCADDCCD